MQARNSGILAELLRQLPSAGRLSAFAAVFAGSLLAVVAATAVVPGHDDSFFSPELILERLETHAVERLPDTPLPYVFDERIQPGDTIQSIFQRLGISDAEALSHLNTDEASKDVLRKLRAGNSVIAAVMPNGSLASLSLPVGRGLERFVVERSDDQLSSSLRDVATVDTMQEMRSGTITHSLFGATDAAGVPDSVAMKFAEIFGTQIDFTKDLRKGDQFSVVYETAFDHGVPVRTGRILAAEFINQGKKHTVVLHREGDGNEAYYTPDGRGLNQAFLRYPLEFSRISSTFGRRLHPIHKRWRSHNGTDFAAARGTPVKASSDGKISFVGTQRGYGNTVKIQHRNSFSTLYAHLNGFAKGIGKGRRVRQGDVIGYVGSTGWATGPHLHYEIRVNDTPQDPMRIALPAVEPLDQKALAAFKKETTPLLERLALLSNRQDTTLAAQ
jgi:murein DD-endopeptidase MepM/ murein hydrolase activator NlpD